MIKTSDVNTWNLNGRIILQELLLSVSYAVTF